MGLGELGDEYYQVTGEKARPETIEIYELDCSFACTHPQGSFSLKDMVYEPENIFTVNTCALNHEKHFGALWLHMENLLYFYEAAQGNLEGHLNLGMAYDEEDRFMMVNVNSDDFDISETEAAKLHRLLEGSFSRLMIELRDQVINTLEIQKVLNRQELPENDPDCQWIYLRPQDTGHDSRVMTETMMRIFRSLSTKNIPGAEVLPEKLFNRHASSTVHSSYLDLFDKAVLPSEFRFEDKEKFELLNGFKDVPLDEAFKLVQCL